jgi:hypothetical protein
MLYGKRSLYLLGMNRYDHFRSAGDPRTGGGATDPELIWHWPVLTLLLQNLLDLLSLVT